MRIVAGLLVTLSFVLSSSSTAAQVLNGQWFKIVVSAEGVGLEPESMEATKDKVKPVVRYAQFILNEGGEAPSYSLVAFAPTELGTWEEFGSGTVNMLDAAETFVGSATFFTSTVDLPDDEGGPHLISIEFNATVKTKIKNEELKSSKIKSLGAITEFSNDAFFLAGKGKISMTRVPVEKLPFTPVVMVK